MSPRGSVMAPGSGTPTAIPAVWLLSDRASFVTGVVMPVDGGCHAWLPDTEGARWACRQAHRATSHRPFGGLP
jgi:hypothetical protein